MPSLSSGKSFGGSTESVGMKVALDSRRRTASPPSASSTKGGRSPAISCTIAAPKWAIFLMSLKGLLERGKGAPYPDDPRLDLRNSAE